MTSNHLYETLLNEADKSRFLKPMYDFYSPTRMLPSYDDLLKFVNTDNKMNGFDWQKAIKDFKLNPNNDSYFDTILKKYNQRLDTRDKQQAAKQVFNADAIYDKAKAYGFTVANEGDETNSETGFVYLKSISNDTWDFIVPMTYEAAIWCDSVDCGNEGAKWCIGYKISDSYWEDYLAKDNLFVLAFNKKEYEAIKNKSPEHENDTLKFMMQLNPEISECQAWLQSDDPDKTIPAVKFKEKFGVSVVDIAKAVVTAVCCDDNEYTSKGDVSSWTNENLEFECPWTKREIEGKEENILYFSDIVSGLYDNDDSLLLKDCRLHNVVIDFEDHSTEELAGHFGFEKDKTDFSAICDFFGKKGVFKNTLKKNIAFRNAVIPTLIWEPEATNCSCNLYLINCNVYYLNWCDFSSGSEILDFDEDCRLGILKWATTYGDDFYSMSTSNLKLNGLEPDEEEYEEDEEEEYEESLKYNKKFLRENGVVHMTNLQKAYVEETVKSDFETGMTENDYDEVKAMMEEDEELAPVADEATDYYFELLEMGPAGFYEEFPELDWDEDFINQYGDDNYSEDTDDRIYDDDYVYKYISPEEQKLYNLFKGPCDHCDTVVTFEIPTISYGNIWFDGEIDEQEDRCIQNIVDNLKNAGYIIDRVINKGDHCTIMWLREVKESVQKKVKSLKEDLDWQTDANDAMEALMILEDKENIDDYCFLDKDVGNIYKIFDRSEDVAKLYDANNDCIINEIPFDELDEEDKLGIEMGKNPPDLSFLD
jgi:ribosomal protein S20